MEKVMKNLEVSILTLLLAVLLIPAKSQAEEIDTTAAQSMNAESDFIMNEYGMITEYKGASTIVIVPAKIGNVDVKGLAGTFLNNTKVTTVYLPDTVTTIGDKAFSGASSLSKVGYYEASVPMTADDVMKAADTTEPGEQTGTDTTEPGEQTGTDTTESGEQTGTDTTESGEQTGTDTTEPGGQTNTDTEPTPPVSKTPEEYAAIFKNYVKGTDGNTFYAIKEKTVGAYFSKNIASVGIQVFYGSAISCFAVDENNTYYTAMGPAGNNKPEGVYGCLLSKDGKILVSLAPSARYTNDSTSYILPDGIEEIKPYACSVSGAERITIPTTTTTIDDYAFCKSGNLLGVIFAAPSKVATIGSYTFADNPNLDIVLPASVTKLGTYCFANVVNRTPDISGSSIEVLPEFCFAGCVNLHTIKMPKTLQEIQAYAFYGDVNINEVVFLGETLKSIGASAFENCDNLHKINIPEGVTAIEDSTFSGCQNLNDVVLPDSLKSIGDNAFADCNNIHKLVIPPNVTHISKNSFSGVTNTNGIDTSKNVYAQAAVTGKTLPKKGKKFTVGSLKYKVTKVTAKGIEVSVVGVKSKKIKKATIGATVTYKGFKCKIISVGTNAFKKCKKLKRVTIGKNVKTLGRNAFYGDSKLATITIKSKVLKSVGKNAIRGVSKKARIKVPKTKVKKYKKLFKKSTGYKKTMRISK